MFKKMMKHLVNNPGLKILSVLFSVVLWLVVVNMADPEATKSFSVPVEILNKNVITEMGKVPDIIGDTDIAVFYITGARSYVEDMGSDDFSVTADLSQVDLSQDEVCNFSRDYRNSSRWMCHRDSRSYSKSFENFWTRIHCI